MKQQQNRSAVADDYVSALLEFLQTLEPRLCSREQRRISPHSRALRQGLKYGLSGGSEVEKFHGSKWIH